MNIGEPILSVLGRGIVVAGDDIDTDRIIPARFMKGVTFEGLGEHAFADERRDESGASKGHPFDQPRFAGASVLISGRNFGCGSSREHAPQALYRAGIRAVVAESFAEIFFGNCTTLGVVCIAVNEADGEALRAAVEADPSAELALDVAGASVTVGGRTFQGTIPAAARDALLAGDWDPLAVLRARAPKVAEVASKLPYASWTGLVALLVALTLSIPAHAAKVSWRAPTDEELKIAERPLPNPAMTHPDGEGKTKQICRAERSGDALLGSWAVEGCDAATGNAVAKMLDAWEWPSSRKNAPPSVITVATQRVMQKPEGSYEALPAPHAVKATFRPPFAFPKDALAEGTSAACIADVIVHPWGATSLVAVWDCPEAFQRAVAGTLLMWEWSAKKATAPIPTTLRVSFDTPQRDAQAEAEKAARKAAKTSVKTATKPEPKAKKAKDDDAPAEAVAPAVVDDEPEELATEVSDPAEVDASEAPAEENPAAAPVDEAPAEEAAPAEPTP